MATLFKSAWQHFFANDDPFSMNGLSPISSGIAAADVPREPEAGGFTSHLGEAFVERFDPVRFVGNTLAFNLLFRAASMTAVGRWAIAASSIVLIPHLLATVNNLIQSGMSYQSANEASSKRLACAVIDGAFFVLEGYLGGRLTRWSPAKKATDWCVREIGVELKYLASFRPRHFEALSAERLDGTRVFAGIRHTGPSRDDISLTFMAKKSNGGGVVRGLEGGKLQLLGLTPPEKKRAVLTWLHDAIDEDGFTGEELAGLRRLRGQLSNMPPSSTEITRLIAKIRTAVKTTRETRGRRTRNSVGETMYKRLGPGFRKEINDLSRRFRAIKKTDIMSVRDEKEIRRILDSARDTADNRESYVNKDNIGRIRERIDAVAALITAAENKMPRPARKPTKTHHELIQLPVRGLM